MLLETWIFGAILTLVGFLVAGMSIDHSELGLPFAVAGVILVLGGSLFCASKFMRWLKNPEQL